LDERKLLIYFYRDIQSKKLESCLIMIMFELKVDLILNEPEAVVEAENRRLNLVKVLFLNHQHSARDLPKYRDRMLTQLVLYYVLVAY